ASLMPLLLLLLLPLLGCYGGLGFADGKVCNTVSHAMLSSFKSYNYSHCTVVDGSIVLSMMEMNGELTFPNVVEISGFVVLYRLKNVTSLGRLFPRLTVIRGFSTHENYALVIFDLPDLQDMALPALRYIGRGGVRVENAPKLCYYKSVNWAAIVRPDFIREVRFDNVPDRVLCSDVCPGRLQWIDESSKYVYHSECPVAENCWSRDTCQSLCSPACGDRGCLLGGNSSACCHQNCLGGCRGPGNADCIACRHLLLDGRCVDRCPASHVSHQNWMCISHADCLSRRYSSKNAIAKSSFRSSRGTAMKLFNGTCVETCPLGYEISSNHTCVKCVDKANCTRYCEGLLVHSIEDLEAVKGCTSIGQLIISLSDNIPDLERKLEENFRNLTEIEEFLLVTNSRDLTSLSFLANLRVVHGKHVVDDATRAARPTIKIEHTDFLQSLWNTTGGRRVSVPRGKVQFYMNRRLCYNRIQTFVNETLDVAEKVNELEDLSPKTNGDLAYCINRTFDIVVGLVSASGVILHWPDLVVSDQRYVLGYSIYYRLVGPDETVQYADPSTCEIRQWQTTFSPCDNVYSLNKPEPDPTGKGPPPKPLPNSCHLQNCSQCIGDCQNRLGKRQCQKYVHDLRPASRYALFVMPQILLERQQEYGSKSRIIYVETLPTQPSPPHQFDGKAASSDEIRLEWRPPLVPNGRVTHYLLWVKEIQSKQANYALKDYCEEKRRGPLDLLVSAKLPLLNKGDSQLLEPDGRSGSSGGGRSFPANSSLSCRRHCQCEQRPDLKRREKIIYFEDTLLRIMFRRRPESDSMRILHRNATRRFRFGRRNASSLLSFPVGTESRLASPSALLDPLLPDPADATPAPVATVAPTTAPKTNCPELKCHEDIVEAIAPPQDTRGLADGYTVVRGTQYTVTNLRHFTSYELMLVACLDEFQHPQYSTTLHLCSNPARIMRRTLALPDADEIPARSLSAEPVPAPSGYSTDFQLLWRQPDSPNGAVIYYDVEYKTDSHRSWQYHCVSFQEWLNRGHRHQVRQPAQRQSLAGAANGSSSSASMQQLIGGTLLKSVPEGDYQVRVRAVSLFQPGRWSLPVPMRVRRRPGRLTADAIAGVLLVAMLLLGALVVIIAWVTYRRINREKTVVNENPDYWSYTYEPDEWEVPRDQVTYSTADRLGTGSFGRVYRGLVRSLNTPAARYIRQSEDVPVAVKSVNDKATMRERHEFLQEATHMKKFRQCAHVVRLIGVVSENVPILVLMELMENGDLKTCLRQMRPDTDGPVLPMYSRDQLVLWCAQIADGMYYLETRKYIHRDLAARNCMVTAAFTVKIGDFGMTRDVYYSDYYKKEGQAPLPVRWMAPESLRDGVFTTASDVWSYGVVLWEIASLASQPFNGRSNEEVLNMVKSGKTLEPPEDCPEFLADLMARCWAQKPKQRSSFSGLLACIDEQPELRADFRQASWYHSGHAGDSAVTVCLPDRSSAASSCSSAATLPACTTSAALKQVEEQIPMLHQQSVPNAYVHLRA
ncbi:hypothetical protein BOX15_Mlig024402g2, partial [Macrostomum lignano]